jgi:transposase
VISGIIFVIRNGLRWRDAPKDYGPHKTIYNRFIRCSLTGSSIRFPKHSHLGPQCGGYT